MQDDISHDVENEVDVVGQTTEPTAETDTSEDTEAPAKERAPVEDNFTETKDFCLTTKPTGAMEAWPHFTFYYGGMEASAMKAALADDSDGEIPPRFFYPPKFIYIDRMGKEGDWCQEINHKGKTIGPRMPKIKATGGNLAGRAALELYRRNNSKGGTLTFPLYASGLWITMEPANEDKFVELDFSLQHEATKVGLSTTGLLLNARSGVFSDALVRLALEHVVGCNYPLPPGEMVNGLLSLIDPMDYGTLIWGVMATKFVNGHPWEFECSSNDCEHTKQEMISFARMLWVDKASLTERQLDIMADSVSTINDAKLEEYRNEFKDYEEEIEMPNGDIVVLSRGTLGGFLATAKSWVSGIEQAYTKSVSSYHTKEKREQYLDQQYQARRLAKYEHMVKEIRIPNGDDFVTIDDEDTVHELLREMSGLDDVFHIFESAVLSYIERSTIAVVGYRSRKCPSCGYEPQLTSGRFRNVVPIAIDRLLFTLAQQRNLVFAELANV